MKVQNPEDCKVRTERETEQVKHLLQELQDIVSDLQDGEVSWVKYSTMQHIKQSLSDLVDGTW